jgi:LPXTG-motif cell wall-anchored protein
MKLNRVTRGVALVSGAGLAAVPMAFAATPSLAAADCGEGTEVSAGICEKAYTTAGDYTFAVPASVAKMSAVLVGGGQGGGILEEGFGPIAAYAGSGGGVLFVDSVDISAPITLTVGAGGSNDYVDGEDTVLGTAVAGGGYVDDDLGPVSGSPQEFAAFMVEMGPPLAVVSGGGAGGTPTTCAAGPGVTASSVAAGSSLFPAVLGEPELGQGGSCSGVTLTSEAGAGKGGDVYDELPDYEASVGTDGSVILRWSPALPDTGMNAQPWMIGAGVATVAAGAVLASGALRLRRQGRHSN